MEMSKVIIIEKSKITKNKENGGLFQQGLFKIGKSRFQIFIKSDSFNFQSKASLSKWSDENGFLVIKTSDLLSEYGENPIYIQPPKAEVFFDKVWGSLETLAKEFVEHV